MNHNPYAPTVEVPEQERASESLERPMYPGAVQRFDTQVGKDEVIQFSPLPVSTTAEQPKPAGWSPSWSFLLAITACVATMALLISPQEDSLKSSQELAANADTMSLTAMALSLFLWVLPLLAFISVIVLIWLYRQTPWTMDPPVWQTRSVTFHPTFWEAEMGHQDGQPFVARFAWSATGILQNERAWLLNGGFTNPAIVRKAQLGEQDQRVAQSFFQQLVDYQQQEQIQHKVLQQDFDDELSPDLEGNAETQNATREPAIPFDMKFSAADPLRMRLAQQCAKTHPHLEFYRRERYYPFAFRSIGWALIVTSSAAAIAQAAWYQAWILASTGLAGVLIGWLFLYIAKSLRAEIRLSGDINRERIRTRNGPAEARVKIEDYPTRLLMQDSAPTDPDRSPQVIVLASATGKQVLVLPATAFASDAEFDAACQSLKLVVGTA